MPEIWRISVSRGHRQKVLRRQLAKTGAMVEVPALLWEIQSLSKADFLSVEAMIFSSSCLPRTGGIQGW